MAPNDSRTRQWQEQWQILQRRLDKIKFSCQDELSIVTVNTAAMLSLMKLCFVLCTFILIVVVDIAAEHQWGLLSGTALDLTGNVYVIDTTYMRIVVLDGRGNVAYDVPYNSTQPHMDRPVALAVDAETNLFVLNGYAGLTQIIHRFADGGRRYVSSATLDPTTQYVARGDMTTDNAGHLYFDNGGMLTTNGILLRTSLAPDAASVSVSSNGDFVYVFCYKYQTTNLTVRVFDNQGNFKQQWNLSDTISVYTIQLPSVADDNFVYYINNNRLMTVSIQYGTIVSIIPFNVQFSGGLALNGTNLIATNSSTRSVFTIDINSGMIQTFAKPDPAYFKYPTSVIPWISADAYVVVDNNHITVFDLFGIIKDYEFSFLPTTCILDGKYFVLTDTTNARIVRIRWIDGVQTNVYGESLLPKAEL